MDMLKYILLTVVTCLSLWGCYDDKGNYDYHDLDEIVIDSTGAWDSGRIILLIG